MRNGKYGRIMLEDLIKVYKGKKVYYVVLPCCDFFNEVYDDKCNYLGAPDGGFTGGGDGNCVPGIQNATKTLIWKDPR